MPETIYLPAEIRHLRTILGIPVRQICEEAKVQRSVYYYYESGKASYAVRSRVSRYMRDKYAQALLTGHFSLPDAQHPPLPTPPLGLHPS